MNRRNAINRVVLLLGGSVIGADFFLSGCSKRSESNITDLDFSADVIALLDEVGETILPTTPSSPGAKAVKIGEFMQVIVTDCYKPEEQEVFMQGVRELVAADFTMHSDEARHGMLVQLDQEAKEYAKAEENEKAHYFTMIKQLTLWGYFTSEVGSKNALRYNPVPGRYDGCTPYEPGDKAWAAI